jgi:HEAT repeat protein
LLRREIEVKPEERKRKPDWAIVPLEVEMDALAALALAMNRKDLVGFKGEVAWAEALEIIERALKGRKETPSDVLGEAAAATLVRWSHNECIEFCHQLVQEFFAAYALRSPGRWDEAIACCQNLWWWETLFMLGGLAAIPETGGSPEKWAALTRRVLGDGQSEPCVFVAVGLLGSVEDPAPALGEEITAALVAHTEVPLTEGQQRAAQELGRILGDEAVEMFRALLRDPDRRIKGAALLCALTRPQATTVLLFGLRGAYSSVLVPVGAPAVAPLIAALGDKREDVQQEAAEALGILGDARAVEPLIAALGDESEFVRRKVAEALGRLGDAQAIEPLSAALGDEREDVRWEAAAALGRLGDARAVEPLSAALGDEDWSVRQSAAAALGRLGGAAVEPLIAALGDNYWSVRGKAAEALGRLEDARAVEPLINALGDENRFVRGKTAVALRTLTGQNFGRDAARWQRWWREQQRGV